MNKKIALSINEMKHLESLGLDTSDASMYYGCRGQLEFMMPDLNTDVCTPAYTLQDILKKLPCSIEEDKIGRFDYNLRVTMMCDEDGYLSYETDPSEIHDSENNPLVLHETECKNILDSAFDMLLWCIENNYIKTNKVCG